MHVIAQYAITSAITTKGNMCAETCTDHWEETWQSKLQSVAEGDKSICLNFKLHHHRQIRLQLLFFRSHRASSSFFPFVCFLVFKSLTIEALSHHVPCSLPYHLHLIFLSGLFFVFTSIRISRISFFCFPPSSPSHSPIRMSVQLAALSHSLLVNTKAF